jgi:hypothetical protein
MGGFKKLKQMMDDIDRRHGIPFPEIPNDEAEKHLELHCLFEIAGNLDTIAVEMRNQTELFSQIRNALTELRHLKRA